MSNITTRLREWLVRTFIQAIGKISNKQDREDIHAWLTQSREVLSRDGKKVDKLKELYAILDAKKTVVTVAHSIAETVRNYKNADLPLSLKIAIPATLLAVPFIGGAGAGIVALGGGLGVPVLLLVFLGTAGITSVLEGIITHKDAMPYVMGVLELIARDEIARCTSASLKAAMREEPIECRRFRMPPDEEKLRRKLLEMDPFEFEQHVVSFFKRDGMLAWNTRKSNDLGVDGFAEHRAGLFVIQCKRHSPDNSVGGPLVQQFKGVIEENGACCGYLVTTSFFTIAARESAAKSDRIILVDMDELVKWHAVPPEFLTSSPP